MKILVDADACPVKDIIKRIAHIHKISVVAVCDNAHEINISGWEVITVDKQADSADFKIISLLCANDIVITGDYGLASMALAKRAYVLGFSGKEYTAENIDILLMQRHINKKTMKSGGRVRGPKKRSTEDNDNFEKAFEMLISLVKNG